MQRRSAGTEYLRLEVAIATTEVQTSSMRWETKMGATPVKWWSGAHFPVCGGRSGGGLGGAARSTRGMNLIRVLFFFFFGTLKFISTETHTTTPGEYEFF